MVPSKFAELMFWRDPMDCVSAIQQENVLIQDSLPNQGTGEVAGG